MEVMVRHQDGRVETRKVKEFVHPYPISKEVKDEIIRLQKSQERVEFGRFTFEDKMFPIAKVVIDEKPTWFIDGRPLVTVLEYRSTKICVQIKMARGENNGERRKEYQAFVYNLIGILGGGSYPVFPDRPIDYFNELTSIDCNGYHPFDIVK